VAMLGSLQQTENHRLQDFSFCVFLRLFAAEKIIA
jgi:hypothetical protein